MNLEGSRTHPFAALSKSKEVLSYVQEHKLTTEEKEGLYCLLWRTSVLQQTNYILDLTVYLKIRRPREFFAALSRVSAELTDHHLLLTAVNLLIMIHHQLEVHPKFYEGIEKVKRERILHLLLKEGADGSFQHLESLEIRPKVKLFFDRQKTKALEKWREFFEVSDEKDIALKEDGIKIFSAMSFHDHERLSALITEFTFNFGDDLMPSFCNRVSEFAAMVGCTTPSDYFSLMEYIRVKVNELAKSVTSPTVSYAKARREMISSLDLQSLVLQFNALKEEVSRANATAELRFASDYKAVYHYIKHRVFDRRILGVDEYFAAAADLFSVDCESGTPKYVTSSHLSQCGTVEMAKYANRDKGTSGVLAKKSHGDFWCIATVMWSKQRGKAAASTTVTVDHGRKKGNKENNKPT